MTNYPREAYGNNPHADRDPNANLDWGPYQWPQGVPEDMLGTANLPGGVKLKVRKELVELEELLGQIAFAKFGRDFSTGWTGAYDNRPIAGSKRASNHSKGKASDHDARNNPMSRRWVCDIPPELIAIWERCGYYWGGRYTGDTAFDTMHKEYCFAVSDVTGHVAIARAILGSTPNLPPAPAPQPKPAPAPIPTAPNYPLSGNQYYGPLSGPAESISGKFKNDTATMRAGLAQWQQRMRDRGWPIGVDGYYGPNTADIAKQFQAEKGLPADGLIGRNTWAAAWTAPIT